MRAPIFMGGLLLLALCGGASAEDCKPLQLFSTLPLTPLGNSGVFTVPVSVNGAEKQFLFDTGGFFTQVSAHVAKDLNLRLDHNSGVEMYGVDGSVSKDVTTLDSFAIGAIHGQHFQVPILPDPELDGLFSPVGFKNVDFDLDFAARKLNIISNDHCEGKVIYWPYKAATAVPITIRDNKLIVPVLVDGHEFTATVDTGASTSTMRLNEAERIFGLSPDSPGMKKIDVLGGDEKAGVYAHPFKTLTFEGITVNNPTIRILTDVVNKNADHSAQTGNRARTVSDDLTLPPILLGMDVLRRLHVYIALRERRLYLTEASDNGAGAP